MELSISLELKSFWKLSGKRKMPYSVDDINVFLSHFLQTLIFRGRKTKGQRCPKETKRSSYGKSSPRKLTCPISPSTSPTSKFHTPIQTPQIFHRPSPSPRSHGSIRNPR